MDEKHHVDAAHDSPRSFPVQDLEQLSGFLKWEIIYKYSKKEITYKKSHTMKVIESIPDDFPAVCM